MGSIELLKLKLRFSRQGLNLTQQDVAKIIGVSLRTYQRLESGQTPLDVATLYKFCDTLNINFLNLTSPDIQAKDLPYCEFYSTEEDLLDLAEINETEILRVKEKVKGIIKDRPEQLLKNSSNFDIIFESQVPLLITDAQTTVANKSLNNLNSYYSEAKWKAGSKFQDPLLFSMAWQVSLSKRYSGFKIRNAISADVFFDKYFLILNASVSCPIAVAQVV